APRCSCTTSHRRNSQKPRHELSELAWDACAPLWRTTYMVVALEGVPNSFSKTGGDTDSCRPQDAMGPVVSGDTGLPPLLNARTTTGKLHLLGFDRQRMVASAFSADRTSGLPFHVSPRPGCYPVETTRANAATYGPYRLLSDADGSSSRIRLTGVTDD